MKSGRLNSAELGDDVQVTRRIRDVRGAHDPWLIGFVRLQGFS